MDCSKGSSEEGVMNGMEGGCVSYPQVVDVQCERQVAIVADACHSILTRPRRPSATTLLPFQRHSFCTPTFREDACASIKPHPLWRSSDSAARCTLAAQDAATIASAPLPLLSHGQSLMLRRTLPSSCTRGDCSSPSSYPGSSPQTYFAVSFAVYTFLVCSLPPTTV